MADSPILYTRLPGRGLRKAVFAVTATRCRLYLAADHLLAIDRTVGTESYRRFYFRDIEAIVIRRTASRQIVNWVLLAAVLLTSGPLPFAWLSDPATGAYMVVAICFAAFWLFFMLLNTLRGPTCQTHVRTAVQLEHLPSLGRVPVARRVLGMVHPLIEAAQGAVTEEEYAAAPWIDPALVGGTSRPVGAAAAGPVRLSSQVHPALFILLLLDAVITGLFCAFSSTALLGASILVTFAAFVLCIVALVRQVGSDVPLSVRSVVVAALVYHILGFAAAFVFAIIYGIRHPGEAVLTGLEIAGEPGFYTVSLISAIVAAVLGLLGLATWLGYRRAVSAAAR